MPGSILRRATEFDFDTIVFNNIEMARETEGLDLEKSQVIKGVKSALGDSNKGFYLIAEVDDQPAGQLMITREWSDWRNKTFWWIQSLYIKPEYRHSGIFSGLYQKILDLARADGNICGLRLYVDADNSLAQQVYQKFGMNQSRYLMYEQELTD